MVKILRLFYELVDSRLSEWLIQQLWNNFYVVIFIRKAQRNDHPRKEFGSRWVWYKKFDGKNLLQKGLL